MTCTDIVQNYDEKWLEEHPEIESDFVQKLRSLFSSLDEENIPYNQYARYKSPAAVQTCYKNESPSGTEHRIYAAVQSGRQYG